MTDVEQFHVSKSLPWYAFKAALDDIAKQGVIPEEDKDMICSQAGDYRKITSDCGETCGVYIAIDNDVTLNLIMSACKYNYRSRLWPVIANKIKRTAQSRKLIAMVTTYEDDDEAIKVLSELNFQAVPKRVETYEGKSGQTCDHILTWFWDECLHEL